MLSEPILSTCSPTEPIDDERAQGGDLRPAVLHTGNCLTPERLLAYHEEVGSMKVFS
jgi:hypothetical protein